MFSRLNDLDVVRQTVDHEHVGQLGAELVVELGLLAFLAVAEELRLLHRVGREERGVVAVLAHGQRDETLLGELELASFRNQHFGGNLVLHLTHRFVGVDRQIVDRTAALRTNDVGAPAVIGEAVGQTRGESESGIAPQEVVATGAHVFLVIEFLDRHGLRTVRQTQQEMRQRQADVARVLALAETVPFGKTEDLRKSTTGP